MDFMASSKRIEPEIIAWRRKIHANPELSLAESETSRLVCAELDKLELPYVVLADHAVVAKLIGGRCASEANLAAQPEPLRSSSVQKPQGVPIKPKTLAIRADMDALPITEETNLAFASANPGVMHACGHDGHTAILLGTARLLADARAHLNGVVYFCFQPAEEIQVGSRLILDYLAAEGGVDRVIAAHLWPELPSGELSVLSGARMAAGDFFRIEVQGKGGHGSRPDLCIDPIKPLCDIVLKLSALPANRMKTTEPSVVHIGQIEAGSAGNVFPQTARAFGGLRSFSTDSRQKLKDLLLEVSEHTAASYGASVAVEIKSGTPPLVNDAAAVDLARWLVSESALFRLHDGEVILASEDFGFYLEQYPGFMCFVGIRNEEKGIIHTVHHPKFDLDEEVLAKTAAFFSMYAAAFLT